MKDNAGKEWIIRFDPEECIQCHGCEIACKSWRNLPYGIQYRRVLNIWQGSYPNVKSMTLSLACLHCTDPDCAEACPEEAIVKDRKTGRVEVNEELCVGCETCTDACPYGVPQFGVEQTMQKCDLCLDETLAGAEPPCIDTCPGNALEMVALSPDKKKDHEANISRILIKVSAN